MSDVYEGDESPPGRGAWTPFEERTRPAASAADRWRPGSPVTPVGSRYGAGTNSAAQGPADAPPPPPPPPPAHRPYRPSAAIAALSLLAAAAAGVGIGHAVWPGTSSVSPAAQGGNLAPNGSGGAGSGGSYFGQSPFGAGGAAGGAASQGAGAPSDISSIAAKVDPALVDVNSTFTYQNAAGAGTGIVLSSSGLILTNNHVIDGATSISVTDIGNHRTYAASVVGYDPTHDIAVLQLQGASGLQTAKLGDSAQAKVGEPVVALGNAGGVGGTPASAGGSITALRQAITAGDELEGTSEQLSGLIQVNADVQSGDSGGSLVNSAGQVIGMDTAASAGFSFQTSGTEGYAIPIDLALSTARRIESGHGSAVVHVGATAFLGLLIRPSSSASGPGASIGGTGSSTVPSTSGATVSSVVPGDPAQRAGVAAGDVITSFAGKAVNSASALSKALVGYHPGDKVVLRWTDTSGTPRAATVDLGSGPPA